jgi:hypothetical protein
MKPEPTRPAWPRVRGAAFADAVAARHGGVRGARPVERVLRAHTGIGITPGARAAFALQLTARFALSIAAAVRSLPGSVREILREREVAVPVEARAPRFERLVERLRERELRRSTLERRSTTRITELLRQANAAAPATRASAPAPGQVPRVLARPASVAARAAPAPRPHEAQAGPAIASAWRIGASAPAPVAAAIDTSRLARDVMRSIDERILAHRERMGRS